MSQPYIGTVMMFAGDFAIQGWQMCNGQTLPINQYAAVFSILGTTYGGNGTSTFQLPNMQGRFPTHQGNGAGLSPKVLGQIGGSESATLLVNNLPTHSHAINASSSGGTTSAPSGAIPAVGGKPDYYSTNSANVTMSASMVGSTGGNVPVATLPPYLTLTFLIALIGIFPSRS